ncbi:hypothetical protein GLOTRDRAFT_134181 [Gloeophyllum trabeum ATCC 11539]|uniref:Uncharacterized protein n=1 Tax=Gloeophyllum trabeum (strain ATCC 11539 / FP-39264 / Madison 617) TaxID=670483 RepID=S7PQU5_GLOTA|nr:uncharacterized protein GLOTRDRAFT_134181 [Gloeophyllum trabeum ATCC 11539]EPQ50186.1 hypothetical protein GLOTRDRAFT_134181 [Gloeophyllum trabeum ATCC 11539]
MHLSPHTALHLGHCTAPTAPTLHCTALHRTAPHLAPRAAPCTSRRTLHLTSCLAPHLAPQLRVHLARRLASHPHPAPRALHRTPHPAPRTPHPAPRAPRPSPLAPAPAPITLIGTPLAPTPNNSSRRSSPSLSASHSSASSGPSHTWSSLVSWNVFYTGTIEKFDENVFESAGFPPWGAGGSTIKVSVDKSDSTGMFMEYYFGLSVLSLEIQDGQMIIPEGVQDVVFTRVVSEKPTEGKPPSDETIRSGLVVIDFGLPADAKYESPMEILA